jgi:hypothetical protein
MTTTFFLDLWHDLREKRLWPVAVGLLAAALAIPVVMLKPASAPQEPPVTAQPPHADALPAVTVDSSATHGSKLETFSVHNPFKPMRDLASDASASPSSPSASRAASASSGPSGLGSGSGASPSYTPGGGGGGSTSPSFTPGTTTHQWFRYTADLSFGTHGKPKTLKGVQSLSLLPDDATAAIVFMGVSEDAKSATFMVADPAFIPAGEGSCNSKKACRFVKLRLDDSHNEETFTSQDGSIAYEVKLLALHRENISDAQAKGDTTPGKANPKQAMAAGGKAVAQASADLLPKLTYLPGPALETK